MFYFMLFIFFKACKHFFSLKRHKKTASCTLQATVRKST